MAMGIGEILSQLGSIAASLMFVYAMYEQFCPSDLHKFVEKHMNKFTDLMSPCVEITFYESSGERLKQSEIYTIHYKKNAHLLGILTGVKNPWQIYQGKCQENSSQTDFQKCGDHLP